MNPPIETDQSAERSPDLNAEYMLPDTHRIDYPALERDCDSWTYIGQLGGAIANWVDDTSEPSWGVTVLLTGKEIPIETTSESTSRTTIHGNTRPGPSHRVSGYQVDHGPSNGDCTTTETIVERYGTVDQTPRESSRDILESVLKATQEWLQSHDAKTMRDHAIENGYESDPLPEPEIQADENQTTLG